jgi:hypothetical protein
LKRPKSKAIPAAEVRRLLEAREHSPDELSRRYRCQVFDLAYGSALLVFEKGRGRLYPSKDAFECFASTGVNTAVTQKATFSLNAP